MKIEFEGETVISAPQVLQLKFSSTASTSSVGFVVGAAADSLLILPDSFCHLVSRGLRPSLNTDVLEVVKRNRENDDATRKVTKFFLKFRFIPRSRKEQMMSISLFHDISSPTRSRCGCHARLCTADEGGKCSFRKRHQTPSDSRRRYRYQACHDPQEGRGGVSHAQSPLSKGRVFKGLTLMMLSLKIIATNKKHPRRSTDVKGSTRGVF